jgi:protein-S-isoprenylcysteine O-methyltransferase Ste14
MKMPDQTEPRRSTVDRLLSRPIFDRLIGAIAFSPFAVTIWDELHLATIAVEDLLLILQLSVMAVTMVARRAPRRITHNPLFWILAFGASYWPVYTNFLYQDGDRIVPRAVSLVTSTIGFLISIWARVSLGRNIGFVPAERAIVTSGIYRFVRHPIYTGLFIGIIADEMAGFSWRNVALDIAWISLFVVKSHVEESFLVRSSQYAEYKKRVRWRWFPGIA